MLFIDIFSLYFSGDNPVVEGLKFDVTGSYAAPYDFSEYIFTDTDGEARTVGYPGTTSEITSYGIHNWSGGIASSARALHAFGRGTESVDLLQNDLEFRFTGVWGDSLVMDGADTVQVIHMVVSGGSIATMHQVRSFTGGDLGLHPLNPNPGVNEPFAMRIPFEVWDVERNMQINFLVVDRIQTEDAAEFWAFNPTNRMYCFSLATPYHAHVADYTDFEEGVPHELDSLTWNTVFWAFDHENVATIRFNYANPIQLGVDGFTFSTADMAKTYSESEAKSDIKNINVFPNPYYAYNARSTGKFDKFIKFTNLPDKATIRIFDLTGTQVRKLEKVPGLDVGQFFKWDLLNEDNLPVASGLYIAHIDMPDLGKTKILKMYIIQGDEILEYF